MSRSDHASFGALIGACLISLLAGCAGSGPTSSTGSAVTAPPTEINGSNPTQTSGSLRLSPQLSNSNAPRTTTKITTRERLKTPESTTPIEPGEPALPDTVNSLFFTAGSASLSPEGRRLIQTLAERLKENRRVTVTLVGHSDDTGSTEFDIAMAQRRVDAAAGEFQKAGVLSRQIRRISYGNEAVKTPCTTETCRQRERRVDLVIEG